ncbi:GFA family protein [soil metagenome]
MRAGGCQCGSVRFTVGQPTLRAYACHCRQCQKQSASAFGVSVPIRREIFEVSGRLGIWSRATDSGGRTDCAFCPECGVRVFHARAGGGPFVTIKGGGFDDTSDIPPAAHIWTIHKQAWLSVPADVPVFETQPDDMTAWRIAFIDGAA